MMEIDQNQTMHTHILLLCAEIILREDINSFISYLLGTYHTVRGVVVQGFTNAGLTLKLILSLRGLHEESKEGCLKRCSI